MRQDFDAIPDPDDRQDGPDRTLIRVYHDIGLATVADALNLLGAEFEPELNESLERGEYYLSPADRTLSRMKMSAY